ncbi:hypothetical protein FACS189464_2170 [Bacteroidia bacterium]|nr:hypothetical protein FACS189464_2170 [Bacteroidia bacterium]
MEIQEAREQYKHYCEREDIIEFKKEVAKIIQQRQLSSVMNDTKWIELQCAIDTLPFPPAYIQKCLTDKDDFSVWTFDKEPHYLGDWSSFWDEGISLFFNIEWIKVRPRLAKYRGRLVTDEILDETEEFEAILTKYNIPYEEDKGTFIIYGYK